MPLPTLSVTFILENFDALRAFYENCFQARACFDAPDYLLLVIGGQPGGVEIGMMKPQPASDTPPRLYQGGAVLNICTDHVDRWHERVCGNGFTPVRPLQDNPWGDRGFAVADPAGSLVYCYSEIPPAPDFEQFHRKLAAGDSWP